MKATEHKATFDDALAYLALNGPSYPSDLGDHLWPDKSAYGPPRGGPRSSAVAAAWLLGKLVKRGLATHVWQEHGHPKYDITPAGSERIRTKHATT